MEEILVMSVATSNVTLKQSPGASSMNSKLHYNLNTILPEKQMKDILYSWNDNVYFHAVVQIRKIIPILGAISENLYISKSTQSAICGTHWATVISINAEKLQDNSPVYDTSCSAEQVACLSNCKDCVEFIFDVTQAEDVAVSTHKCKKTYYIAARDGDIDSFEFNAYQVPSLNRDLIGGRAATNCLDFQIIRDTTANLNGSYPRHNDKL
jgi:hypothetical protein